MPTRKTSHKSQAGSGHAAAVIGMACRFPDAPDCEQFWHNLRAGVSSIRDAASERWPDGEYYSADINAPGKTVTKRGGWLDGVDQFDHAFFGCSPREAAAMDPQQRLLLQETWHCLEDAGVTQQELAQKITSAFVGVMAIDYPHRMAAAGVLPDAYGCSGTYECMLANRLSYFYGFRGTSQTVNTACSSSLVALHDARRVLLAGESDFAIVAGVNLNLHPWKYIAFSKARMLSPDGLCKTFDQDANGYVPGEGVGVLLLRRLDDALRSGNHIYGILKGSAVNHGGRAASLTAPRVEAQRRVIAAALRDARVHPDTISYVEAHGTGTSLGDPIEIEALTQAFRRHTEARGFCKIGSVKTNIGHLEAAAGIAGVIKVLLMLRHGAIPKTNNLNVVNPMIDFGSSPFEPALGLSGWERAEGAPRRAGISSFGFGGVNAHVVVEEFIPVPAQVAGPQFGAGSARQPFLLSAKSAGGLQRLMDAWRGYAATERFARQPLPEACRALAVNRTHFPFRFGATVRDASELLAALGRAETAETGAGNQKFLLRIGEAGDLDAEGWNAFLAGDPGASRYARRCREAFRGQDSAFEGGAAEFTALYAIALRLVDLGLAPDLVCGEGTGRWVALAVAGVVDLADALDAARAANIAAEPAAHRARLAVYDSAAGKIYRPLWCDAAYLRALLRECAVEPAEFERYAIKARALLKNQFTFKRYLDEWNQEIRKHGADLYELLSGSDPERRPLVMTAVVSSLRRLAAKWSLSASYPVAGIGLRESLDLLADGLVTIPEMAGLLLAPEESIVPTASAIAGRLGQLDARKRYELLRLQPAEQTVAAGARAGGLLPGAVVIDLGRGRDRDGAVSLKGNIPDNFAGVLVELWKRGANIAWARYPGRPVSRKVDLPLYPFDTARFWFKGQPEVPAQDASFSRVFQLARDRIVASHVIAERPIVPGAAMIEMALAGARRSAGAAVNVLSSIGIHSAVIVEDTAEIHAEVNAVERKVTLRSSTGVNCTADFAQDSSAAAAPADLPAGGAPLDTALLYEQLRSMGYAYGEDLRVIRRAWQYGDALVCDLEERANDEGRETDLSPYLLDGVFQCVLCACLAMNDRARDRGDVIYVPYLIERLRSYGRLTGRCRVLIRRDQVLESRAGVKADVMVEDGAGHPALEITGLLLKQAPRNFLENRDGLACQRPVWIERAPGGGSNPRPEYAVVFGGRGSVRDLLAGDLAARGVCVFHIDTDEQDYAAAWKALAARIEERPLLIYHLGCLEHEDGAASADELRNTQEHVLRPLVLLLKALLATGLKNEVRLISATRNAQFALAGDAVTGFASGTVAGLAAAARLENRKLRVQAVDFDESTLGAGELARILWDEACCDEETEPVAYRAGKRYVRDFQPVRPPAAAQPFRRGGVYVITGGAGGIGLKLASMLLRQYGAHVVLLGRSELSAAKTGEWDGLSHAGGKLLYLRCDVTNAAEVAKALEEARSACGPLTGVIHCAGVLEDKLLLNKDWASFARVLAPKTYGAWALDAATQGDRLELFALFSSIVSLRGNAGQSDYAAANSFLDAFAHFRRRRGGPGKTIAINWTLWAGAGMGRNAGAAAQLRRMGITPLESGAALRAFAAAVTGEDAQIMITNSRDNALPKAGTAAKEAGVTTENIAAAVAKVLSCNPGDIDADADFAEYGMDSVAIMHLADELERQLPATVHHSAIIEHPTARKLAEYLAGAPGPAASRSLAPAASARAHQAAEAAVAEIIAAALSVQVEDLDPDTDIAEYGADSVAVMQIVSALEAQYGDGIQHSLVLENPTIRSLASRLGKRSEAPQSKPPAHRPVPPPAREDDPIAVIGMACRFPKSPTLESFWDNLVNGRDLIAPVPAARWSVDAHYHPEPGKHRKTYSACGGFIEGVDLFDAGLFGVREEDAPNMDPQQRIFLEIAQELLDRSGYARSEMAGTRTGLFIGGHESNYGRKIPARAKYEGKTGVVDVIPNMIAGRVADFYDLRGPAEMIYTACSSSLVAVHRALNAIRAGDCQMAMAGGIELLLDEEWFIGFSQSRVLSADGKCHVFDRKANGFVLGEGVGAVLLKPLQTALRDGDRIHGVIRGSAVNNDGRTMGLTTPNQEAQKAVIQAAFARADISPELVSYYEAHGTGTALGDPIEIRAATQVFRESTREKGFCAVGSVKSNMGHALAAAGAASLIKVLLSLQNRTIPPTLHCEQPHPRFEFAGSPFYPVTRAQEWSGRGGRRAASISSFGFGGTNCHVIVEGMEDSRAGASVRPSLPLTPFRRKRYWLTPLPSHGNGLEALFQRVASGEISARAAAGQIKVAPRQ